MYSDKKPKVRKPTKEERDNSVPRDRFYHTGVLVAAEFYNKMNERRPTLKASHSTTSPEVLRNLGLACDQLKISPALFVHYAVEFQPPTARMFLTHLLGEGLLKRLEDHVYGVGRQMVTTGKPMAVVTSDLGIAFVTSTDVLAKQLAVVENTLDWGRAILRGCTGGCTDMTEAVIKEMLCPLHDTTVPRWAWCLLSRFHPIIVEKFGVKAQEEMAEDPGLRGALEVLKFDVARLDRGGVL